MTRKVLVIDDEPDIRELVAMTLKRMDLCSDVAATCQEGIQLIKNNDYFLVLTDMRLPDGDGNEVVKYIQKNKPMVPVAVITAFGNVEGAVNTLKNGAFDYVTKPVNLEVLQKLVSTSLKMWNKKTDTRELLIGESKIIKELRESINKVSRSQAPVYIQGASGVGKELVARLIHTSSPRSSSPFIAINCGAIPGELMESEFFGHKKGSFTGAYADKKGLFEAASGGTLFLDEVADLPLMMQVKLFRAIQERAIKPIGDTEEIAVDVRILSASNKDLVAEIKAGRFREELYYRINVIEIEVPGLRERPGDIPLLITHILQKLDTTGGNYTITDDALLALKEYSFPGNVRELENILERAMTLCSGSKITKADLQLKAATSIPYKKLVNEESLDKNLLAHEKELIKQALERNKWHKTKAAKELGVSLRTLRYRMDKLGL